MTNKHTASLNGKTFTRNSAKATYSHVVVAAYTARELIARTERSLESYKANRAKATAEYVGWYDEHIAADEAKLAAYRAATDLDAPFGEFFAQGWTSRLDLANKLAASTRAQGYSTVVVLPATVTN